MTEKKEAHAEVTENSGKAYAKGAGSSASASGTKGPSVSIDGKKIEGKESIKMTGDTIVVDGKLIKQDGQFVKTGAGA